MLVFEIVGLIVKSTDFLSTFGYGEFHDQADAKSIWSFQLLLTSRVPAVDREEIGRLYAFPILPPPPPTDPYSPI
jgi:hypothetical protein